METHWIRFKSWIGPTKCSGYFVGGRGVVCYSPDYERRMGRPVLYSEMPFLL